MRRTRRRGAVDISARVAAVVGHGRAVAGSPQVDQGRRLAPIASALWMAMANLAPVVVTALLLDDPATAAGFAGVVLTRVPLLLMAPIQALLLPGLTAAVAIDDSRHLRATGFWGLGLIAGIDGLR